MPAGSNGIEEPVECASPPCLLHEIDPAYSGLGHPHTLPHPEKVVPPRFRRTRFACHLPLGLLAFLGVMSPSAGWIRRRLS